MIIAMQDNVLYSIDPAQKVKAVEIDVKKIGCDFMAFLGFIIIGFVEYFIVIRRRTKSWVRIGHYLIR
jgi:aminotransferase class V